MVDGEGNERVWYGLSPEVSLCRYATAQHRVDAIHLRASHCNEVGRINSGIFTVGLRIHTLELDNIPITLW